MYRNRLLKAALYLASGVVILLALGVVSLFLALPTPYKIKESLNLQTQTQDKAKEALPAPSKDQEPQLATEKAESVGDPSPSNSMEEDSRLALAPLIDTRKPLSAACRTLTSMDRKQTEKLNPKEFGRRFQDSLLDKSSDPLMESLKPVLKLTLTQPSMQELIAKVEAAQPEERTSLMSKMDFYSSAYSAYQEMIQNKPNMEHVLVQSYLTMMLGRVIEVRPDLAQNRHVLDYCEQIEKILNEGEATDFQEAKRAFMDFLSEVNVDPNSIGFDPHYKTRVQIKFDKSGLHFRGGWIDEVFAQLTPKAPQKAGAAVEAH